MIFGRFEISCLNFGFFRLDGGAMFGSVPKNLWEKRIKADNENCIPLATRSLIICDREKSRTFLVDVGMGEKWSDKQRQIFAIQNTDKAQLKDRLDKVTDIILTHLHFDHAGGISRYKVGSSDVELNFPKANVYLQKDNWENAKNPNLRERASYLKENVFILEQANVHFTKGSQEIYPDIWVHQVNGHTLGQQWVEVRDNNLSIVYPTDLIPTSHHLALPFNMGYDICTQTLLKEKEQFLNLALQRNSIIVFEHDPSTAAGRIAVDDKGHYVIREQVAID